MARLIPVWTEIHTLIAIVLLPALLGTAVAAHAEPIWVTLAIAALFALTSAAAIASEPFMALAVGLAGAAAMIFIKQAAGRWDPTTFSPSSFETLFLVGSGLAGGALSGRLRRSTRTSPGGAYLAAPAPVFGSLGLLPASVGESRLEEEVERARLHNRPLALLRIEVEPRGRKYRSGLERQQVLRAVARLVESMLRVTDIPYAYDERCIMVVLPETDAAGATLLARRVAEAVASAPLLGGPDRTPAVRQVGNVAKVRFNLATLPEHAATPAELLAASKHAPISLPTVDGGKPAPGPTSDSPMPASGLQPQVRAESAGRVPHA